MLSRESEVAHIRSDLQALISTFDNLSAGVTAGPPKKNWKLLFDSDDDDQHVGCSGGDDDDRLTDVDRYFSSAFDCEELTPLQFWKNQASEKKLPKLSVIARSVYTIPASQNRSQRAFSGAGHVLTDLRTTLDPDHVDELLLLRSHYRQAHEKDPNDDDD